MKSNTVETPVLQSLVTIPVLKPKGLNIAYQHHFFVQTNITIRDTSQATRVWLDLDSDNGSFLARVHSKVFAQWQKSHPEQSSVNLSGVWRATLYGQTMPNQSLKSLQIIRLTPLENAIDLNGQSTFWSAAGKVLRLDRAERIVIIRVYPRTKGFEPFVISAKTTLELLNLVQDAWYVHMTGVVEQGYLIAQNLEPMRLDIPSVWKDWIPPSKRKVILENTLNSESSDSSLDAGTNLGF